jgi:hypothetical protein
MLFGHRKGLSISMITGRPASLENVYVPGSGVGARSRSTARALSIRSAAKAKFVIVSQPPSIVSANLIDGAVVVSWTPPTNTGDSAISYYIVTSTPGGFTQTIPSGGGASRASFGSLTNGVSYVFSITALNLAGNSTPIVTDPVSAYSLASPPASLVATRGNASLSIAFSPPTNTGGTSITNYQYSINDGASFTALSPEDSISPISIIGLTNGTTYQVKLKTVTIAGASAASVAVSGTPVTTPDAPTSLVATPGVGSLSVVFSAPSDTGGDDIINYKYSTDNGATFTAFSPATTSSPVSITGLTNGTSYNVKLKAVNSIGDGAESSAVTSTPRTTPGAPTSLSATAKNASAEIAFAAPTNNGGADITNYEYSIDGGTNYIAFSPETITSPVTITELTNETTYNIKLKAVNVAGAGTASAQVSVKPRAFVPLAGSLEFDGTNKMTLSPGAAIGAGAYTVECWFYNTASNWGTASPDFSSLFGHTGGFGGAPNGLAIWFSDDRTIQTDKNGGGLRPTYAFSSPISLNQWHHFALVRNSSLTETVFIDGVKATTAGGLTNIVGGQQTNSGDYSGAIDEVGRFYQGFWTGYLTNIRIVSGTAIYDPTASSITTPIQPLDAVTNTQYLMLGDSVTTDAAGIQTVGNVGGVTQTSTIKPF